jgi:hypothetical protein
MHSDLYFQDMKWDVSFCDAFDVEFQEFDVPLQNELLARLSLLGDTGPSLGRPHVDTLKGSRHPNMKELRFSLGRQPYRFLFAFDPLRNAVVLVGGSKAGDARFYDRLIPIADDRYDRHLATLQPQEGNHGP